MTPIERVSARGRALSKLNLPLTASIEDIRVAYRAIARQRHPDLNGSCQNDFAEINAAHDYLIKNAKDLGISERNHPADPRVRRPTVSAMRVDLTDQDVSECQSVLETAEVENSMRHVPVSIFRRGRQITYLVRSSFQRGTNLIAVPTGPLVDNRRVLPQVVSVEGTDIENGAYEVPANVCAELFPGAKGVKIQFSEVA